MISDLRLTKPGDPVRRALASITGQDTRTLVLRLHTTSHPLVLWFLHAELTRRGLPPCQRWPGALHDPQADYITWAADLDWFARRHTVHAPAYRGWRGIFTHTIGSDAWHATAHRQFLFVQARYSLAHWCSKGLALTDQHRVDLMTMPTKKMVADRRQVAPAAFADLRLALMDDAMAHPDRSGQRQPTDVANRRASLWQTYVLAGRNMTETARCWAILTGEQISRQAIGKQVDAVKRAMSARSH